MREYFPGIWDKEKSEYLKSRQAETGRTYSSHYIYNNRLMVEDYFLPFFEEKNIKSIDQLNHQNLLEWRNALVSGDVPVPGKRKKSARGDKDKVELSPVTINKVRQAVWVGLTWAVEIELFR